MKKPDIIILTGKKQSGKTSLLRSYCNNKTNVYGILTPVIQGKRMLLNILTNEMNQLEAEPDETNILSVGKYMFKQSAFDIANKILLNSLHHSTGTIIIDEIGPLELNRQGLYYTVKQIFQKANLPIIVVVREGLVEDAIVLFNLEAVQISTLAEHDKLAQCFSKS